MEKEMGKSKPSQPTPVIVNAAGAASEQAGYNREAALQQRALNAVNQFTPQGSTTYGYTGEELEGIPQMSVTQTLSPEQQGLYDTSTGLAEAYGDIGQEQLRGVRSSLEQPFSTAGLGQAPVVNEATRNAARDAILARLEPQMTRGDEAMRARLASEGFGRGSEGYDEAMDQRNRARADLYLGADVQSGNEMARMYGLESSARDRAINEALMQRTQPLAELSSFMGGSQPQAPRFLPTPGGQIAAPDFMGAEYGSANQQNAAAQNAYNQNMSAYNQKIGGLYDVAGLGAQAAGWQWSDRRLKQYIKRIGRLANGLAVYSYRYVWGDESVGLMADEVKTLHPHAVCNFGGFDAVNYAEAVK
jgi:hypothetical protein